MFLRAPKIEVSGGEEHGGLCSAWNRSSISMLCHVKWSNCNHYGFLKLPVALRDSTVLQVPGYTYIHLVKCVRRRLIYGIRPCVSLLLLQQLLNHWAI